MRYSSIGAAMASAALMSLSMASSAGSVIAGAVKRELRDETPAYSRPHGKFRRRGQTKKHKGGLYKGSRWAKKATRLGGNPARF